MKLAGKALIFFVCLFSVICSSINQTFPYGSPIEQDIAQPNPTDAPLPSPGANQEQLHQNWSNCNGLKPAGKLGKALPAWGAGCPLPASPPSSSTRRGRAMRGSPPRAKPHGARARLSCAAISCASYPCATDCANMNVISLNNHQRFNSSQTTQRPNSWRWSGEGLFAGFCNTC